MSIEQQLIDFIKNSNIMDMVSGKDTKFYIPVLVDKFLAYKQSQGIEPRTYADYKKYFKEFSVYHGNTSIDFDTLKQAVQDYLSTKSGKAPATFNVPYTYLNCFFNWAVDIEGALNRNPLKVLKFKKVRDEGKARAISEQDLEKLKNHLNLNTYHGFRDYCVIVLTMDTGIRPSELFKLTTDLFDKENKVIKVTKDIAKTDRDRYLPLSTPTVSLLDELIKCRDPRWEGNLIFYTVEGEEMTTRAWEQRLYKYSKELGIKITPYDFRHTFAIMYLRRNGNMFALQEILGHTDLTMTKRYVKLAESDLVKNHGAATPVYSIIRRTTKAKRKR